MVVQFLYNCKERHENINERKSNRIFILLYTFKNNDFIIIILSLLILSGLVISENATQTYIDCLSLVVCWDVHFDGNLSTLEILISLA